MSFSMTDWTCQGGCRAFLGIKCRLKAIALTKHSANVKIAAQGRVKWLTVNMS